jgi:hypothetical protein
LRKTQVYLEKKENLEFLSKDSGIGIGDNYKSMKKLHLLIELI